MNSLFVWTHSLLVLVIQVIVYSHLCLTWQIILHMYVVSPQLESKLEGEIKKLNIQRNIVGYIVEKKSSSNFSSIISH